MSKHEDFYMKNQELINELIQRVERVVAQEEAYKDLSFDALSIQTTVYLCLKRQTIYNYGLLNKLLFERDLLMAYSICDCLNSMEFNFKHENFTTGILHSLITYLDKELDTLARITATYDNLHNATIEQINEKLENAEIPLLKELNDFSKSENEWIQLYSLMFSQNE